jgi:hypothetical protein
VPSILADSMRRLLKADLNPAAKPIMEEAFEPAKVAYGAALFRRPSPVVQQRPISQLFRVGLAAIYAAHRFTLA